MRQYHEINSLPVDIQRRWMATIDKTPPTEAGKFTLVGIRPTSPAGYQELKVIVQVIDENRIPLIGVDVIFSYDTAKPFYVDPAIEWQPPLPWRGDVVTTGGDGAAQHVQGSVVKQGQPGGITVFVLSNEYSSDVIHGLGALADHTGLLLTLILKRPGVRSYQEQIDELRALIGG